MAQSGRAQRSGRLGRKFKSSRPDHLSLINNVPIWRLIVIRYLLLAWNTPLLPILNPESSFIEGPTWLNSESRWRRDLKTAEPREKRTEECRMSNRRMSKGGIAALYPFIVNENVNRLWNPYRLIVLQDHRFCPLSLQSFVVSFYTVFKKKYRNKEGWSRSWPS